MIKIEMFAQQKFMNFESRSRIHVSTKRLEF